MHSSLRLAAILYSIFSLQIATAGDYEVKPLTDSQKKEYLVDGSFYKKGIAVHDILIATSERVADHALLEAAYQFDKMMGSINPEIAQRVREKKVLCILIGHEELTSDLPQFQTDKTGKELDFYNWRQRGFLTHRFKRPIVVFAEEDVLEYEGGMQIESILIHEFGHVIHGAGFNEEQQKRLTKIHQEAKAKGLWNDGRAAQRFRRVTRETPVSLLDALAKSFPDEKPELLKKYLDGGDILVNGKATTSKVEVTKDDKVLIMFGGEKECYARKNRSEYWAEGVQCWYNTNRTMDHDHNHIHTRAQLKKYDTGLAQLCEEVLGTTEWRFVSPRERAGTAHLAGFDPAKSPIVEDADHIKAAANDYYDKYWKPYWQRLRDKQTLVSDSPAQKPNILVILVDDMGYGDLGCFNKDSKIPTPNIDSLARDGMRFTDAHAPGPLCHMSRYGLITGRYPFRANVHNWRNHATVDKDQTTIASLLKTQGYRTAMVGKWHLGFEEDGYDKPLPGGPVDVGFDSFFGIRASTDIPDYFYIRNNRAVMPPTDDIGDNHSEGDEWTRIQGKFWRKGKIAPDLKLEEVLPRFTDEAISVIEKHDQEQPLMLYLAYPAPHTPWLPTDEFVGKSEAGLYGDFTMMVDAMVGKVLGALKGSGMADDTLVIFSSDNGPVWYAKDVDRFGHDSVGGLRGMKSDAWEGGHRMPFIARWPEVAAAGSSSDQTICFTDLLATFATITGYEREPDEGPDSYDFSAVLRGNQPKDRAVRPHLAMRSGGGHMTVRVGDWKLIDKLGSGGFSKPNKIKPESGGPTGQLFNLKIDPAETNNLFLVRKDKVEELQATLKEIVEADN